MATLLAGAFSKPPAYIQLGRHASVTFHAADDTPCWSDPNGRIMVNGLADARTLLDAHGYVVGPEIPHPEGLIRDWRYSVV